MTMKKRSRVIAAILILFGFMAALLLTYIFLPQQKELTFTATGEVLPCAYSGYAPDGRNEDLCEDTTLVYVEVTLRDIEPEEDVFDFSGVEEEYHLSRWKATGKHMVLRLVLDCPGDTMHCDIPDWLYEKTADGTFYDNAYGKGYCPDYSNPVLIEAHTQAVAALASWAEQDGFAAYVEIGSLGHWGEWHVLMQDKSLPPFPDTDVQQAYADAYMQSFHHARLLMRRPFSVLPENAGVYNDMTGDPDDTSEWLSWIEDGGTFEQTGEALKAVPQIWDCAPVGGEFTSGTSMSEMMGSRYETTRQLVESSYMCFIGPMVPQEAQLDEQAEENTEDLLRYIGPRYRVSAARLSGNHFHSSVTLTVINDGVCPVYFEEEKLVLYVTGKDGTTGRIITDLDLTALSQREENSITISLSISYEDLMSSAIRVGIETGQGIDRIPLFMSAQREDQLSVLFSP